MTTTATVFQTTTAQDKLDLWLAGGNVPSVEYFHPTPEEPIVTIKIGEMNGEALLVYGAKVWDRRFRVRQWKWSLDRETTFEVANFDLFRQSREGDEFFREAMIERARSKNLLNTRRVVPKVGQSFDVYCAGVELCLAQDVCRFLHEALFQDLSRWKCTKELPLEVDTVVPPVCQEVLTICPHCADKIMRYGTRVMQRRSLYMSWFQDRVEAERMHAETVEEVLRYQAHARRLADWKAFQELAHAAFSRADGLQQSPSFRTHRDDLDDGLVEQLEEAQRLVHSLLQSSFDALNRPALKDGDGSVHLPLVERLDELTDQVTEALKAHVAKIAEEIDRCGLVGKLRSLLDTCIKMCPLCHAPYQRDDEWLRKLLMEGSARAVCRCPDRYNVKENPPAPLPELTVLREFLPRAESLLGHAVPIERIKVGAATVAEFLIGGDKYQGYHGVVAVDREALRVASAKVRSINVWPQTAILAYAAQIDHFEKRVAKGELLKLNLRYDHNRQTWSERRRVDGIVTIYTVAREHEAVLDGAGSYYCREFRRPASAQKPDFALVLVTPYMRVP